MSKSAATDRLTASLETLAAQRPRKLKPEEYCSFCGEGRPGKLFCGPCGQICNECATVAVGMFIVAWRDGLRLSDRGQYLTAFTRAREEYFRVEGKIPRVGARQ